MPQHRKQAQGDLEVVRRQWQQFTRVGRHSRSFDGKTLFGDYMLATGIFAGRGSSFVVRRSSLGRRCGCSSSDERRATTHGQAGLCASEASGSIHASRRKRVCAVQKERFDSGGVVPESGSARPDGGGGHVEHPAKRPGEVAVRRVAD